MGSLDKALDRYCMKHGLNREDYAMGSTIRRGKKKKGQSDGPSGKKKPRKVEGRLNNLK